jgi:hypothetical protein
VLTGAPLQAYLKNSIFSALIISLDSRLTAVTADIYQVETPFPRITTRCTA